MKLLVVHPIGTGIFSEEQFAKWMAAAAGPRKHRTFMIGTSHADGSSKDTGVSIPIAYGFVRNSELLFIRKNEVTALAADAPPKA